MGKGVREVGQKGGLQEKNSGNRVQSQDSFMLDLSSSVVPNVPYLDLSIYRETEVKALIRKHSKDMYSLLSTVHFDGNYYRVKCVRSGELECCWDLAVKVQFFGKMQGVTLYPSRSVSEDRKRIVYKSFILVNPYELWEDELVNKFWNLQERLEFLIARILFHECIHVMIALGKILPAGFGETDIFFEFRTVLDAANSEILDLKRREVQFRIWNLVVFGSSEQDSEEDMLMRVLEIYEFLINEKYSTQKAGKAFGHPWGNKRVAGKYAWMAAVKAGGSRHVEKKVWETETRRLRRALVELYDLIDGEIKPGRKTSWK
ncbi:hypothetical protein FTO70_03025 [Methanosarcina sp. KYL-1]|uniref:hypothetical protein n=1 Tax=Methanosarcina sp. KYL-1 TaxID=2602068 RepID=UPI002100DFF4|nr:hypothetical protein [Methanosarcina sp. KYL-1]MCQ1534679.1 hypothetical protein [Methanosarcina sp. KYL-1]